MNTLLAPRKITYPFPGLTRQILTSTVESSLVQHTMASGSIFPWHSHPHEQTVFVIAGDLFIELKENGITKSFSANAGDSWVIAGDIPHRVTALSDARVLDFFTPCRQDYLGEEEK